jgi:hypothetical protein
MSVLVVAEIHDDDDAFVLHIKLMDDRSVDLTYPKPNGILRDCSSYVTLTAGNADWWFGDETLDEFEDWAKIATGAMPPERERRWLCQICGDKQGFGPMLPDEIWHAIAPNPHGLMCLDCMRARATACLGRSLAEVAAEIEDAP